MSNAEDDTVRGLTVDEQRMLERHERTRRMERDIRRAAELRTSVARDWARGATLTPQQALDTRNACATEEDDTVRGERLHKTLYQHDKVIQAARQRTDEIEHGDPIPWAELGIIAGLLVALGAGSAVFLMWLSEGGAL